MAQQAVPLLDVNVTLNNGLKMPKYSFGTWKLPAELGTDTVTAAIDAGFRHIDCARIYVNEPAIGVAFEKAVASGKVTRGDLWITSKLWNNDHDPAHVEMACRRTINDLKCGFLDLYLIHWPVAFEHRSEEYKDLIPYTEKGGAQNVDIPLEDTWRAMEALVDKGLVKSIGISNFSTEQADAILKIARIKPVCNQVELHAALPQTQLRKDMADRGIVVQAYSPLGYGAATDKSLMDDPEIQRIAAKAGMSPAQLLLAFVGSLPNVVLLTKSQTASRIAENAKLTYAPLPDEILKELEEYGIKNRKRTVNPDIFYEVKGVLFFKD